MSNRWILRTHDYVDGISIARRVGEAEYEVLTEATWTRVAERELPPYPAMLTRTSEDTTAFLQAAMDFAYARGLRPSKAQDERHIARHLEDMRALTFKVLNVPMPGGRE